MYEIMGIDVSKAFDCISRSKLLEEVMKPHIDNSPYSITIQYFGSTYYQIPNLE